MAQIRKAKASSACSLDKAIKIFFTVAFLVSSALVLFQLDAFPRKHRYKRPPHALTPDQLVVSPPLRPVVKNNDNVREGSDPMATRRYVMELANLSGEPTTAKAVLEVYPHWAPIGAQHFDDLISQHKFYDECRFFRVVNDFVVQFGIHGNPAVQEKVKHDVLKDDPVKETNALGTISYATSGTDTRTTQLFINTRSKGNAGLDKQGFAPFGKVVEGMEHVLRINSEYAQQPTQGRIQREGNAYLNEKFPRLSYIASLRPET